MQVRTSIKKKSDTAFSIGVFVLFALLVTVLPRFLSENRESLVAVQIVVAVILAGTALVTEVRHYTCLPTLARPSVTIAASTIVASLAATSLSTPDYVVYLRLWLLLVAGMIVASIITDRIHQTAKIDKSRHLNTATLSTIATVVFVVSTLAALYFFYRQGIPALSGNIEQGRVDAAEGGTGYFRLLAYMSGPSAILLQVTKSKYRIHTLIIAALVITGMANRSPYLYLIAPLIFIWAADGKFRLSNLRIIAAAVFALAVVVGFGTFRIMSQDEFRNYSEYQSAILSKNYVEVGVISLLHYAEVVPENQVLTTNLVDAGAIPLKYGASYGTLFFSALPGEQLSLDREIRAASGGNFIGGGTPPTLAGEGYVNFGKFGPFISGVLVIALSRMAAHRLDSDVLNDPRSASSLASAAIYGYILCWVAGAPVAGLAGASTVPLAGALLILISVTLSTRVERK